jgi:hypothetical protein
MDKYKTSELGKALKKVFRGQMTVEESVKLCEDEIAEIFKAGGAEILGSSVDTGNYGDVVGICPLCGERVVRGKFSYGCMGFSKGCAFKVGVSICKKAIPKSEVSRLLATGSTVKMNGFISKSGKPFSARLVIRDGTAVFNFD